ncbi:hypothetical protein ES705_42414 [subsurface metagenome]
MKALVRKAGTAFDRILDSLMFLACVIFTFAMLLVCADVVMRYALNRPIPWSLEVCEYILVGIVSLGMAWLLREEGHIRVDFLLNRLKPSSQDLVNGSTSAFNAVVMLIIAWYGLKASFHFAQTGAVEEDILLLPKAVLLIPLSIGCFLFFIQFVRRSYRCLKNWSLRHYSQEA